MTNPLFRLAFLAGLCVFSHQFAAVAQPFCAQPPFAEWPSSPVPLGVRTEHVVAIQADQDGFSDLAWAELPAREGDPSNLWLALSDGNGGFLAPAPLLALPAYSAFLLPGDFNLDGRHDLLIYPYSSANHRLSAALADGTGGFSLVDAAFILNPTTSFSVADFNDDQYPDIVHYDFFGSRLQPYLGNGDGTFEFLSPVEAGFRSSAFGVADVNGDGIDDVAAPDFSQMLLLYSDLGTALAKSKRFPVAIDAPSTVVPSLVAGSFNGDEHADFAGISANHIHVWIGDGTGNFTAFAYLFERGELLQLRAADLNEDGLTDLLLRDEQTGQWFALAALAGGGFGPATAATTPAMTRLLELADAEGDGKLDILGVTTGFDSARLFRQTCPVLLSSAAAPNPGFSGEAIEYTFSATNVSDQATGGIQWTLAALPEINPLSATPSAGTCSTATSCALGSLDPGQSAHVDVDASLAGGFTGETGPTATVSEPNADAYSWKALHWAAPRVVPRLGLSVTPRVVAVNLTATARVTVRNDGADIARNATLRLSAPPDQTQILTSSLGSQCVQGGPGELICALGDIVPAADSRTVELELRAIAGSASPVAIRAEFASDEGFADTAEALMEIVDLPPPAALSFKWRPLEGDPLNGFYAWAAIRPLADWNGDGNVDLIVGEIPMMGSGDGRFTMAPQPNPPVFLSVHPLSRLADVDGIWFLDRNGDGQFSPATEIIGWGEAAWTPLQGPWR